MSLSQCHILTIRDPNACFYHTFDAALAYRFTNADDPLDWWKGRLREKAGELKNDNPKLP